MMTDIVTNKDKIDHICKLIEKRITTHDLDIAYDIADILSTMPIGTQIAEIHGHEKLVHRKAKYRDGFDWICTDVTSDKHYYERESAYLMGLWMYGQIKLLDCSPIT